jgi:hypothetical protein
MLHRQEPRPATHGLPADQSNGAESKVVGLEMMPIDGVTLSDGRALGERTRTRRSAWLAVAGRIPNGRARVG